MTKPPLRATVHTQADLEQLWRRLMEPLGFAGHTLWMLTIRDDGEVFPQVVQIADMPPAPTPADRKDLAAFVAELDAHTDSELRWAFLYSRPGRGGADHRDRAWAQALCDAARRAGARCEPVHLATDEMLVPIPLDDLNMRSA